MNKCLNLKHLMFQALLMLIIALFVFGWAAMAALAEGSHTSRIQTYEGTKTCLQCHNQEALDVHGSAHYQWKGDTSDIVNPVPSLAGKINGINDFCIYANINWIGQLTDVDGKLVDGGCAKCHAGLGAKPTATATRAQLENIDCLICHSDTYKRKVGKVGTAFKFVPDTANMAVTLLQAARNVKLPTKDNCLNCHTKSGGGDNYKRGDIEEAHRNPTRDFDVHMASTQNGGAGLQCTSCHTTSNHRIAGRGSDLRQKDSPDPVNCSNCHGDTPHSDATINGHTAKVNCTVCHIPNFAKIAPTDMNRDWSLPGEVDAAKRLYDPHMVKKSNVAPVYRFFNGQSYAYSFGRKAVANASGTVVMSKPAGNVNDSTAKIHAFKRHVGKQPIDPVSLRLLPLKTGIFFQTGDLASAVATGVQEVGWDVAWNKNFANTERFMGIFHEVAPKEQALSCNNCHGGTRLNFKTLGYTPKAQNNGRPLCSSCHGSESAGFDEIHSRHVQREGYNCNACHTFSGTR